MVVFHLEMWFFEKFTSSLGAAIFSLFFVKYLGNNKIYFATVYNSISYLI